MLRNNDGGSNMENCTSKNFAFEAMLISASWPWGEAPSDFFFRWVKADKWLKYVEIKIGFVNQI